MSVIAPCPLCGGKSILKTQRVAEDAEEAWNRRQKAALATAARNSIIEQCAVAAEAQDRIGHEWVADSLWANILKRAGQNVRALQTRTFIGERP